MNCPSCRAAVPEDAAFCPRCGAALPERTEEEPKDASISSEDTLPGAWHWLLLILLLAERLLAWFAFPVDESRWLASGWETPFLWIWGGGLGLLALGPLAFRRRAGGWLAMLSGCALALRACIPMLGEGRSAEGQVYGAVWSLMVASATITFAFLYEQSFWPRPPRGGPQDPDEDSAGNA